MKKIFNQENIYTVLFIISLYLLFTVIFRDVLRGKDFNIGLKTIPFLIIAIILFSQSSHYFFNKIKSTFSDIKILIIIFISIALSLLIQQSIHIKQTSDFQEKKFINPLYQEFIKVSKKYNLDLSFTRESWVQRGPNNYKVSSLFKEAPKSVDILFIGDSTIAWGLIPKVIEQLTGKNVAMYAYESNVLSKKTSKLFNKLSKYFLKENGIVIFSFANPFKSKDPDSVMISTKEYEEMIKWDDEDFMSHAKKSEVSFFNKYLSFKAFKNFYTEKSEYLKTQYGMALKSPSFYEIYLEPLINPKLSKNKVVNKNDDMKFIRWDMNTITLFNPKFNLKSIHSKITPQKPLVDKNVKINAKEASKIFGKKIYMVPLSNNHAYYNLSRNMYYSYYEKLGFELCDLGLYHPKETQYTMQSGTHMGNLGGLMKTILLGQWLKAYYQKENTLISQKIQD